MDYGATSPCDPRVVDAMIPWLREHFGNPASRSHAYGWEAEAAVERAREQVACAAARIHARSSGPAGRPKATTWPSRGLPSSIAVAVITS
jgi:hypothetical protein